MFCSSRAFICFAVDLSPSSHKSHRRCALSILYYSAFFSSSWFSKLMEPRLIIKRLIILPQPFISLASCLCSTFYLWSSFVVTVLDMTNVVAGVVKLGIFRPAAPGFSSSCSLSVLLSSESYLQETGRDSRGQEWTPILGERFKIITRNDLITSFMLTAVPHQI